MYGVSFRSYGMFWNWTEAVVAQHCELGTLLCVCVCGVFYFFNFYLKIFILY